MSIYVHFVIVSVMDDEDEAVITAGAVITVDVELTRKTLKVGIEIFITYLWLYHVDDRRT